MTPLLLTLMLATAAVPEPEVRGATTCPTPAELLRHLRPLLPDGGGLPAATWVLLSALTSAADAAPDIEVSLQRANDAGSLVVRRVGGGASCAEMAEAVAVIIAGWSARYRSVPVTPVTVDSVEPGAAAAVRTEAPPAHDAPVEVGASAAAGVVGSYRGGAALMVGLEAELRRRGSPWFARLQVAGIGSRETAIETCCASWSRLVAMPTVGRTWGTREAFIDVGAGPLLGAVRINGLDYAGMRDPSTSLDLGVSSMLRVGARLAGGPVAIWLSAGGLAWLRPKRAWQGVLDAGPFSRTLPWLDGIAWGGLTWTPGG